MTNDEIKALALHHGFTEREQPGGGMDLNPYVYDFARSLLKAEREACAVKVEKITDRKRTIAAVVSSTQKAPCELAEALRRGEP